MTYKIISTRQVDETLFTTVEYNFDNKLITVEISHFMPNGIEEITQNIIKRADSELIKLNASLAIENIIPNIVIGEINSL